MWFTARFHFSCYWFNSNLPGLPELDFIRKIWVLVLFFFVFFFSCNISSESFYSKTLQRQTWCLRENGDKSIATHNTCRVLNNGSYLDRAHSAAVLLMCFTTETKGINIFCVFCADKCCCFMLFFPFLIQQQTAETQCTIPRPCELDSHAFNPSCFFSASAGFVLSRLCAFSPCNSKPLSGGAK